MEVEWISRSGVMMAMLFQIHSVESQDVDYRSEYRPCRPKHDGRRANGNVSSICLCAEFCRHEFIFLPMSLLTTNLIAKLPDQLLSHIDPTVSCSGT